MLKILVTFSLLVGKAFGLINNHNSIEKRLAVKLLNLKLDIGIVGAESNK